jgi:hypothetical protein
MTASIAGTTVPAIPVMMRTLDVKVYCAAVKKQGGMHGMEQVWRNRQWIGKANER